MMDRPMRIRNNMLQRLKSMGATVHMRPKVVQLNAAPPEQIAGQASLFVTEAVLSARLQERDALWREQVEAAKRRPVPVFDAEPITRSPTVVDITPIYDEAGRIKSVTVKASDAGVSSLN